MPLCPALCNAFSRKGTLRLGVFIYITILQGTPPGAPPFWNGAKPVRIVLARGHRGRLTRYQGSRQ